MYDYPSNMTGFLDFVTWQNDILTYGGVGFLGIGLMLVLWVAVFAASKRITYDSYGSGAMASVVTTVVSVLMWVTGLVNTKTLIILILMSAASVVVLRLQE